MDKNINLSSWHDLGYRKLWEDNKRLLEIARTMGYQTIDDSSGLWMRRRERHKKFKGKSLIEIVSCISSGDDKELTFFDRFISQNEYARKNPQTFVEISNVIQFLENHSSKDLLTSAHNIALALTFCELKELKNLFSQFILPRFKQIDPNGKVIVIEHNFEYQKMYSFLRALYTYKNHPNKFEELLNANRAFEALKDLHFAEPIGFVHRCINYINTLFFPFIPGFICGPMGLTFIFLFSAKVEYVKNKFPIDWMDWAGSPFMFGAQKHDLIKMLNNEPDTIYSRYISTDPPSIDELTSFVEWLVDRINLLGIDLSDPCNFLEDKSTIDPIWAFENLLTTDRVLRLSAMAITSGDAGTRKSFVFQIADLWDSIALAMGKTSNNSDFFNHLFHPDMAPTDLLNILGNMPIFQNRFANDIRTIYDRLRKTIVDSIYIPGLINSDTITVKKKDLTTPEEISHSELTFRVIRAMRNTHHGYITKNDKGKYRPARFLSIFTGNIPDIITALPVYWWLAFLANPTDFIGFKPVGQQAYD